MSSSSSLVWISQMQCKQKSGHKSIFKNIAICTWNGRNSNGAAKKKVNSCCIEQNYYLVRGRGVDVNKRTVTTHLYS